MNNEVNSESNGHLYVVSPRGYSAYEIAVQNGFVGTEQEWLDSLKAEISEDEFKTINGESIVGQGNIEIDSGASNYNDLTNKPKINNIELNENKTSSDLGLQDTLISGTNIKTINGTSILGSGNLVIESGEGKLSSVAHDDTMTGAGTNANPLKVNTSIIAQKSDIPDTSEFITKDVNNLTYYTLKTSTGSLIDLSINSNTYVITLSLKDVDGNVISTDTVDLPLESVVVGGSYDSSNQKIVLTLQNGNTVDIPVGGLVSGLQSEITSQNKLASDLVDDTNSGHKFVSASEKATWNGKQDALTFDNTPTLNSSNPVKSGGVYTALMGKLNSADVEEKDLLVTYEDTTTETLKLVVYK